MQGNPDARRRQRRRILSAGCLAGGLLPLLSACSLLSSVGLLPDEPPPPPATTPYVLSISLEPDARLNPDRNGNPAPLLVRIFVVEPALELEQRSFEELFDYGDNTIDPRPLAALTLRPGAVQTLRLEPMKSQTRLVVAAAWRDPYQSLWLAARDIDPNAPAPVVARFRDDRVVLDAPS